ncbi:MAG: MBL fold metallo-hydrolase [Lachnospiraceae bacterium]|nr:MBL fold metallo-hydrolase [Lachnospiraceae bacterium]
MRRLSYKIYSLILTLVITLPIVMGGFTTRVSAAATTSSFQVDSINVGQGDAALVQCDGHYMLIDGGDNKQSSLIYSYLKQRSITHLDYIVATHPDADHIGGLLGALNYATVGVAFSPVTEHDTKTFRSFLKYLTKQDVTITVPAAGDVFHLGSATVTVLGPTFISEDSNNNSIVLRIVYGNTSFLFTGDAEEAEEKAILNSKRTVSSTVLKVAHHGSNSSTKYQFLRAVSPQYAVISVGAKNTYGHPTENTLSRLRDAGAITYRTDLQGHIICTSDGTNVLFSPQKNPDVATLADAGAGQNQPAVQTRSTTTPSEKSAVPAKDNPATPVAEPASNAVVATPAVTASYVLNTNTKKFHTASCGSVKQMSEKNKAFFDGSRDEAVALGYDPCKRCNP